jgi:hypothetical protein
MNIEIYECGYSNGPSQASDHLLASTYGEQASKGWRSSGFTALLRISTTRFIPLRIETATLESQELSSPEIYIIIITILYIGIFFIKH